MDVFLGVWDMSAGEFRRGAVGQFRTVSTACMGVLGCLLAAGLIGCDSVPSELLPEAGTGADPAISSENLRSIISAEAVGTESFKTIQSNQQEIELHFVGDEHAHWYEDTDGYTVVLDAGRYLYAELDDNGELAPTSFLVGEADPSAVGLTPPNHPTRRCGHAHPIRVDRQAAP